VEEEEERHHEQGYEKSWKTDVDICPGQGGRIFEYVDRMKDQEDDLESFVKEPIGLF
jgi:hypothetical protein